MTASSCNSPKHTTSASKTSATNRPTDCRSMVQGVALVVPHGLGLGFVWDHPTPTDRMERRRKRAGCFVVDLSSFRRPRRNVASMGASFAASMPMEIQDRVWLGSMMAFTHSRAAAYTARFARRTVAMVSKRLLLASEGAFLVSSRRPFQSAGAPWPLAPPITAKRAVGRATMSLAVRLAAHGETPGRPSCCSPRR